jgi:hypothetical protein
MLGKEATGDPHVALQLRSDMFATEVENKPWEVGKILRWRVRVCRLGAAQLGSGSWAQD